MLLKHCAGPSKGVMWTSRRPERLRVPGEIGIIQERELMGSHVLYRK